MLAKKIGLAIFLALGNTSVFAGSFDFKISSLRVKPGETITVSSRSKADYQLIVTIFKIEYAHQE